MTNEQLVEFFASRDWFDNSRIKMIRGCKRKAFFQLIGPHGTGLATRVGDGANFGSSVHAALARYYNTWGKATESQRRLFAARAFADEWQNYFPHERMQKKHGLENGLRIIEGYFDAYLAEDELYEPVESELGFAIEIKPLFYENSTFLSANDCEKDLLQHRSFWNVGRIDGIFKRRSTGELYLRETKTTGSQVEKRLAQLKFDHQPIGYVYCVRHLAGEQRRNVLGVMGDVIGVFGEGSKAAPYARDYFHVTQNQAESWRRQLINTVEDWRELIANANVSGSLDLDRFYQDTERCFEFGKCAFYEICDHGINDDVLEDYEPATWNPLLKRTPANIEIVGG